MPCATSSAWPRPIRTGPENRPDALQGQDDPGKNRRPRQSIRWPGSRAVLPSPCWKRTVSRCWRTCRKSWISPWYTIDFAKTQVFPPYLDTVKTLGVIHTGFLGTVDDDGALNLYDGKLRLMKADGSYTDFDVQDYTDYLAEQVVPWSLRASFPMPAAGTKAFPWIWTNPKEFTAPIAWRAST